MRGKRAAAPIKDHPLPPPPFFPIAVILTHLGLGSGILFSYPQLGTIAGVQGVLVYALTSALPLLIFAYLGPIIRRKCPEGFVLTEWTRQRYGIVTALWLSFLTLVTMFLYMVSELSAIGQAVNALTGLDALPILIVECVVTTVYTCMLPLCAQNTTSSNQHLTEKYLALGGFRISFTTDNVQGIMVIGLIVIATITIGARTHIDPSLIESSGLTKPNLLGWQLLYIFPVAILTNDFFLSNFWLRTFASKTDRDLWIGVSIACVVVLIILTLVGMTGCIAAWSGAWDETQDGSVAFFLLLEQLPSWVVGIVLVMAVSLSCASFDSLQSAMVSSAANDLFRNRINTWFIRAAVVLLIIPTIVIALKAPSILQIYLISDLLSASTIPVLCMGLSEKLYWWRGFEVVVGGLGGILCVFIFGTIYYGDAHQGANLILLEAGLYEGDWGAFGAFVAAPVGGLLFGLAACALRIGYHFVVAKVTGKPFDALTRPAVSVREEDESVNIVRDESATTSKQAGKFF